MDASTRELVWRRAGRRCEYRRIHQEDEPFFRLHLEQGKTPMPVTIQLDDDLAGQLQRKAAEHRLSLEEFTARLLGGALGEIEVAEAWQGQNRRRVMLIRKSFA